MKKKNRSARTRLTHLDRAGQARMVDVSGKPVTARRALATAELRMSAATLKLITSGQVPKGDAFAAARIAGIQAAKRTAELIPLCHPLPIEAVHVEITPVPPDCVRVHAEATVVGRTGVEMEALTAAAVAALTIYDMCKAVDRGMVIGPIKLEEKSGGHSGTWKRSKKGDQS